MSIQGPDISSHQHDGGATIDFHKVKAAGNSFVIVKASEGLTYYNPFFVQDVEAAKAAGLFVGAYHFVHPSDDGGLQAQKFMEQVRKLPFHLDLPLAMDFEVTDGRDPVSTHAVLDKMRTVLRQNAFRTMTYTYPNFLEHEVIHTCAFCASDPLWYADYDGHLPSDSSVLAPWKAVTLWQQKGSSASIPGLVGGQDLSVFEADEPHWLHFIGQSVAVLHSGPPAWYHRLLEYPPSTLRDPGPVKSGFQYGADVQTVQRKLGVKPDGFYGPQTAGHVKGFQKLHGLTVDGIVGPNTAAKLGP